MRLACYCVIAWVALVKLLGGAEESEVCELAAPRLVVGAVDRGEIALHRVTAASVLRDGSLAIADAGNHRVLIVDRQGAVVRAIGG